MEHELASISLGHASASASKTPSRWWSMLPFDSEASFWSEMSKCHHHSYTSICYSNKFLTLTKIINKWSIFMHNADGFRQSAKRIGQWRTVTAICQSVLPVTKVMPNDEVLCRLAIRCSICFADMPISCEHRRRVMVNDDCRMCCSISYRRMVIR